MWCDGVGMRVYGCVRVCKYAWVWEQQKGDPNMMLLFVIDKNKLKAVPKKLCETYK